MVADDVKQKAAKIYGKCVRLHSHSVSEHEMRVLFAAGARFISCTPIDPSHFPPYYIGSRDNKFRTIVSYGGQGGREFHYVGSHLDQQ